MMAQEVQVVTAEGVHEFTKALNEYLSCGWKLSGGMTVTYDTHSGKRVFYQAIYREYEQPGAWG